MLELLQLQKTDGLSGYKRTSFLELLDEGLDSLFVPLFGSVLLIRGLLVAEESLHYRSLPRTEKTHG